MIHNIYKFRFQTGVHLGNGMLNDTEATFPADILFSALYIEAMKMDRAEVFYEAVAGGRILFSDAFPYKGNTYFVPKPMLYIEKKENGSSAEKKKYKKLKYIPVGMLSAFIKGEADIDQIDDKVGKYDLLTRVSKRNDTPDPKPYHVGWSPYHFGLYVIVRFQEATDQELFDKLMLSLSYTGIGGERSSGLGKFDLLRGKTDKAILEMIRRENTDRYMLISSALPRDEELEEVLAGSTNRLIIRSGFAYSPFSNQSPLRKRDLYVFAAGSCFAKQFDGDVYDVSDGSPHPVYRYARAMFMGVE